MQFARCSAPAPIRIIIYRRQTGSGRGFEFLLGYLQGNLDRKTGSFANGRGNLQRTAMLRFDYRLADCKPLTGAGTGAFRREEQIKNLAQLIRRDARPVIDYPYLGEVRISFCHDPDRSECFALILRYRLRSINNKVDQNLRQFSRITRNSFQSRPKLTLDISCVFPLIAGNHERVVNNFRQIGGRFLGRLRV